VTHRLLWIVSHVFEAATAWCFVVVAVAFVIDPAATLVRSPVGQPVHPFDYLWNGFYFAGGATVIAGLLMGRPRIEVGGLVVLSTGLIAAATAVLWLNPDPRIAGYIGFATASLIRAHSIVRR
jgi:uncharacterized protein with von Willebrand factor type A (vWA) domain